MRKKLAASDKPDRKVIDSIDRAVEFQRAMSLGLDDHALDSRDAALAWFKRWSDAPALQQGVMANVLAAGYKGTGELEKGLTAVNIGKKLLTKAEGYFGLAWSFSVEALLLMKRGDYRRAATVCERGLELVRSTLDGHRMHGSVYRTTLACIHYEFDNLDNACSEMKQVLQSINEYGVADFQILATLTEARLYLARGEMEAGLAILREGQERGHQHDQMRTAISLAAEECIWLCRLRKHTEARPLAAHYGLECLRTEGFPQLQPGFVTRGLFEDKLSRVTARLVIPEQPLDAAAFLNKAIRRCESLGLDHRRVELLILQAIAYQYANESTEAALCIKQALIRGAEQGYRRVFLDDLPEIAPVLEHIELTEPVPSKSLDLLTLLLKSLRKDKSTVNKEAESEEHLIEGLTPRETHILRHLESGLSNREIADAIFISEGTLKWHLHNIYGKLQCKNRSGALIKARSLGLI
ncbi:LuxR C-terminal-related transcriptional regulator [Alcanivorax marinus]|uniref:LuxR C-terminal-related transcriptional regulator n=1 Tax=Alloalcanivorax marinus TaxID=1177169 RepID=A0A9Q3UK49_9GAMM|nr:LuxR C-terminal-related transcriptional regulator [Alloalcanivorax marinus]MCC4308721.1 LuxR C-terminal-related transcriptional regulator [Alloalcanivorax marinus]